MVGGRGGVVIQCTNSKFYYYFLLLLSVIDFMYIIRIVSAGNLCVKNYPYRVLIKFNNFTYYMILINWSPECGTIYWCIHNPLGVNATRFRSTGGCMFAPSHQ